MVFGGGARKKRGNPYLNSTTILFDKSMGFTYPDYFTYLNVFVIQLVQRCSDNGETTVLYVFLEEYSIWLSGVKITNLLVIMIS